MPVLVSSSDVDTEVQMKTLKVYGLERAKYMCKEAKMKWRNKLSHFKN